MKKRMLSMAVAAMMLLGSFANIAYAATLEDLLADPIDASAIYGADADVLYEGNTPLITAERILDELNADAAVDSDIFDQSEHDNQLDAITLDLSSLNLDDCAELLTSEENLTDYKKQYIIALAKAYGTENNTDLADALEVYDTSELGLKESFGTLNEYADYMVDVFSDYSIDPGDYDAYKSDAEEFVKEPLVAIINILFANKGNNAADSMRANYVNEFLTNDRAKKTLAVLFGADLTEEIVSDSADSSKGIVRHVKDYLSADTSRIDALITKMNNVMVADDTSVAAAFDLLGETVAASYPDGDLKDDVVMLMGDGTNTGLFELLVTSVDSEGNGASNTWINLFLSEFVQLTLPGVPADTVSTSVPNPSKVTIKDGTSGNFDLVNLGSYVDFQGIDPSLPTEYFDVVCDNPNVSYNNSTGKFTVITDSTKGQYYDAYLKLYRKSATGSVDTFIESYPVTIQNYRPSSGGGSAVVVKSPHANNETSNRGGNVTAGEAIVLATQSTGATIYYTLDGSKPTSSSTIYTPGQEIILTEGQVLKAIAYKSGYVSSVSQWVGVKRAGESIGDVFDTENHILYMQGYPDGTFKPDNNMTRAEAATMFARLLKDKMQTGTSYASTFTDVSEDAWYADYVGYMQRYGVINGYEDGTFRPDNTITRAEFVTMASRFIVVDENLSCSFADVADGHWAYKYIAFASGNSWVNGYEDGTFRPDNTITRAEVVTVVNHMLNRNADMDYVAENLESLITFPDVTEAHWAYEDVIEATNEHDFAVEGGIENWK